MPQSLALSSGTSVARAGSTDNWPGLPTLPASSGPYVPGDKSEYARWKIDAPAPPLASLPTFLTVNMTFDVDPDTGVENVVIDDYASLGNVGGPLGTNAATSLAIPYAPTIKVYNLPTDGITLANLNAGNVYFYWGCKSLLTAAYVNGSVTFTISPTSPQTTTGSKILDVTTDFDVTWAYPGTDPAYVIARLTGTTSAGGTAVFPASVGYTGSATTDNGMGDTDSGSVEVPAPDPPPAAREAGPTVLDVRILDDGTYEITMHSTTNIVGNSSQVGNVIHTLTASAIQPSPTTVNINALSVYAPDAIIPPQPLRGVLLGGMDRLPNYAVRRLSGG